MMGDNGKLYVSPDMVPAFRNELVPRASLLTPNQFEAERLTEMRICTLADAARPRVSRSLPVGGAPPPRAALSHRPSAMLRVRSWRRARRCMRWALPP